jgi:hypothetical protein
MKPKQLLSMTVGLAESMNPGFLDSALPKKNQKLPKSEAQQKRDIEATKARRERRNQKRAKAFNQ